MNNYLQFSAQFELPKGAVLADIKAWLELATEEPVDISPEEAEHAQEADEETSGTLGKWNGKPESPLAPWRDDQSPDGLPDFTAELDEGGLWVYAEESGSVEGAVALVQAYWEKFGPMDGDERGVIAWAYTCSKPAVGEFGGGAVAFTRTKEKWFNPETLAEKWLKKVKK